MAIMRHLFLKIRIHPVFWIVVGIGLFTGHFWEVCTIVFIVFIHECGHGISALIFGWHVESIQLLPFGGVAKVDNHVDKPAYQELIVTISGPIQHLWLPLVSYLLLNTGVWNSENHQLFLFYNKMILVFNLLPIWPLDGGKILRIILQKYLPFMKAYTWTLLLSCLQLGCLSTFVLLNFPFTLNYFVISGFILISIYRDWIERRFIFIRFLLSKWNNTVGTKKVRTRYIQGNLSIVKALHLLYKSSQSRYRIMGMSHNEINEIEERDILNAYFNGQYNGKTLNDIKNGVVT
ncbi:M50 family metallopeptidase [Terrilactibacillus tamarindi]|nr:M50 family metallopeptidase [Terrilactibacillus tamarindi]